VNRPLPLRRLALAAAASIFLAASGCAGPPVPSDIAGEPVCSDYEVGAVRTQMQGSLRFPVMLSILDGSTVVMKTMILGRRSEKDPVKRILLIDSDEEYEVKWSQCENERAPRPVSGGADVKEALKYECGNDAVYATGQLVTKKGDISTHGLTFVPPPKAECWMSDVPQAALADAGAPADASAPDAGDMDAGGDGGPEGSGASSDAGTGDAGTGDAGADKADAGSDKADAGTDKADAGGDGGAKKKKPAAK
jgi:hypothetical protein